MITGPLRTRRQSNKVNLIFNANLYLIRQCVAQQNSVRMLEFMPSTISFQPSLCTPFKTIYCPIINPKVRFMLIFVNVIFMERNRINSFLS